MKKNLVLLGMMGVGKTTLAKIVAKKHNLKFIDIDANIIKKNSKTISEIFEKKGEGFFRKEEEKEVLKSLKISKSIIALGGGAFMNKVIRESVLQKAVSIWLDANIETLAERVKWSEKRPLLKNQDSKKKLEELYEERKNIYQLADHKINCDKLSKIDITKKIIELYEKH